VPISILYDNLKIAVARIFGDGKRQCTRAFTKLVSHHLFQERFQGVDGVPRNCRVRAKARERLDELRTGDGRPIPVRMKAEIRRELERLELLRKQIAEIEAERDALLSPVGQAVTRCSALEASRHRTRVCVSALAGGALPSFCKPARAGGLCGLGPQPLEKRRFEQRAADLQIWKRAIADHDD
jgi:hypothetical protein